MPDLGRNTPMWDGIPITKEMCESSAMLIGESLFKLRTMIDWCRPNYELTRQFVEWVRVEKPYFLNQPKQSQSTNSTGIYFNIEAVSRCLNGMAPEIVSAAAALFSANAEAVVIKVPTAPSDSWQIHGYWDAKEAKEYVSSR